MSSILIRQKYAIYNLVKSMTIANGFNYDWMTINQLEYNIGTFPRVFSFSKKEKNLDTKAGLSNLSYTNEVEWTLKVVGEITWPADNPMFTYDDIIFPALDDLKKLFGPGPNQQVPPISYGYNLNGTCASFLYSGFEQTYDSKDQFIPRDLTTTWVATYSQDRALPENFTGS